MAYSPPPFLLPAHVVPVYLLPTHRLWPLSSQQGLRPYGPPDIEENGRRYQGFRRGVYPFPCDEAEKSRLFLYHEIFLLVRNGRLHSRQLPPTKGGECRRIVDLGTGPGTWAVAIAELYPDTEVLGIDLAKIQPLEVPRNVRFLAPFDYESCWFEKSCDFVHLRGGLGSVRSWTRLYHSIFQRLKPDGIFEQVEIDLQPRWNNGRDLPQEHPLQRWFDTLLNATTRAGRPIGWRQDIGQLLLSQGFVDIRTEEIRLPITVRPPSYGPRSQKISDWYTMALRMSLEAFSLGPLTQDLGWPVAKARELIDGLGKTLQEMSDENLYNNMHIVTAKRPSGS